MKTLAIALFASLALSACATDAADDDLQPIDKISQQKDISTVAEDVADRAGQVLVPEGVGIQPGGQQWAEDLIVDGKQWTIVHGPRGAEALLDDRGIKVPSPEGIDALLEQLGIVKSRSELKRFPE